MASSKFASSRQSLALLQCSRVMFPANRPSLSLADHFPSEKNVTSLTQARLCRAIQKLHDLVPFIILR